MFGKTVEEFRTIVLNLCLDGAFNKGMMQRYRRTARPKRSTFAGTDVVPFGR
jgi:hypothetical protein